MRYSRLALFPPSTRATLKLFGDVFAKSCYSEMGRLVLLLLTSKSFDSLESIEYLKGKGFAVSKEKNVDLKRKLFGEFQDNVLKSFSKRTLHFIRWSQTN